MGFMIGDALGCPVSAIKKKEIKRRFGLINQYVINKHHPFFYYLKKGQYGSNSRLMLTTLSVYDKYQEINFSYIMKRYLFIAKKSQNDYLYSRWLGKTILRSVLTNQPSDKPSSSCIFPSIPIAALTRDKEKMLKHVLRLARMTHSSQSSLAGAYFIASIIHELIYRPTKNKFTLITREIRNIAKIFRNRSLGNNMQLVLTLRIPNIATARFKLGTGSRVDQLIPLVTYIYLNYRPDFNQALILGANSLRNDSRDDRLKLSKLTYIEQMLECNGGATDSIAGLVAALIGAEIGYSQIDQRWLTCLEDREKVVQQIDRILAVSHMVKDKITNEG